MNGEWFVDAVKVTGLALSKRKAQFKKGTKASASDEGSQDLVKGGLSHVPTRSVSKWDL